jgi:ATP-dependent DNA helicase RecQ
MVMQFLLRKYTGIFADYTIINESEISIDTGLDNQKIYEILTWFRKTGIIDYIPKKSTPAIKYLTDRIPPEILRLSPEVYEHRMNRYKNRMESMMNYVTEENHCRSQILLNYFGEKESSNCGLCDVCIKKNTQTNIDEKILLFLRANGPTDLQVLITMINEDPGKTVNMLRLLLEEKRIIHENNKFSVK